MVVALRDRVSVECAASGWLLLDENAGAYWWLDRRSGEALWTLLGLGGPPGAVQILPNWSRGCYDMTRDDVEELLTWLYASSLIERLDDAANAAPPAKCESRGT